VTSDDLAGSAPADLRRLVEQAFAAREYPGDDRIADSDPRYESYEGHAISAFHRGKRWQEITLRHLLDDYAGDPTACLAFMTPEGWRYYLPAYLVMALDWEEADAIGDAVVGALTHPRSRSESFTRVAQDLGLEPEDVLATHGERFEERISGLSAAELQAVRLVLARLAEHVEAENAPFQTRLPNRPREALESWQHRPGALKGC
jgi:hypothetical protein